MDQAVSGYEPVIEEICGFNWAGLSHAQLTRVAWAYYFFSVQFRENLEIAYRMNPDDPQLQSLVREECDTANLSPWPGVAAPGEKINHDEFMNRLLLLSPIDHDEQIKIERAGQIYLDNTRRETYQARAMSIASYECGGLEAVFKAILRGQHWETPLLSAFRHFLVKHIDFDSNPDQGHGALIKHLVPDNRIRGLWIDFRDLLLSSVPRLGA